ncbi:MAG TPA: alpha/beta hydrolase-fold protein, partial [Lacipirellulaceae bacterium]|nr:alpha/beta hydrolase-fold protein [Lacipirellulaceae bacterium]
PAGYDPQQSADLPTVYVTDGHEYAADHLGGLMATLDNMIAAGQLQPIVAVFLDPRDPTTGANRRMSEYVANDQFVRCVADELVPRIDAEYRTLAAPQGRTVLGTSLGGLASAYLGATRPEVFRQVIVQSPASFSALAPQVLEMFAAQPLAAQLQLFVTAGTIGDGQGARELTAVLADGGYEYGLLEVNQGHSWGNWRDTIAAALTKLIGPKAPGVTHHLEIQ